MTTYECPFPFEQRAFSPPDGPEGLPEISRGRQPPVTRDIPHALEGRQRFCIVYPIPRPI